MLIIIHGEDLAKSRQKLKEVEAEKKQELLYLDGKKLALPDLILATQAPSLITMEKSIVIENFFQRKIGKEKTEIQNYIFTLETGNRILLWENKTIDKAKLSKLPKGSLEYKFDYPANLFKFLDTLGVLPKNELLSTFHMLLKNNDSELIFTMIVRQFRFLIMVKEEEKNSLGIPDWQYFKFKSQAKYFEMQKLIYLYRQLLQMDYKLKSGQTPFRKDQLLDIFLATN